MGTVIWTLGHTEFFKIRYFGASFWDARILDMSATSQPWGASKANIENIGQMVSKLQLPQDESEK